MAGFEVLAPAAAVRYLAQREAQVAEVLAIGHNSDSVDDVILGVASNRYGLVTAGDGWAVFWADDTTLFVWLVHGVNLNLAESFAAELDAMARRAGVRYIEFLSPRPGWQRMAPRFGFIEQPAIVTYRKVVHGS